MKTKILILLSFVLLFSSCGSDDDSSSSENGFTYDGTFHPINLILRSQYEGSCTFRFYNNATFNSTTLQPEGITEEVDQLELSFFYDDNFQELPEGTYTYNNFNYPNGSFFGFVRFYTNFSQLQAVGEVIDNGTVEVTKNNGNYTFVLNLITQQDKVITGTIAKSIDYTY